MCICILLYNMLYVHFQKHDFCYRICSICILICFCIVFCDVHYVYIYIYIHIVFFICFVVISPAYYCMFCHYKLFYLCYGCLPNLLFQVVYICDLFVCYFLIYTYVSAYLKFLLFVVPVSFCKACKVCVFCLSCLCQFVCAKVKQKYVQSKQVSMYKGQ